MGHHCDIPYINMVHFNHIHFLHYSYFFFASPFSLSPPLSEWPGTIYPSCPDKTVFECYNNITVFKPHSTKDFLVTVLKHTHSAHHLLTSKDVRNRGSCILLGRCSNRMMWKRPKGRLSESFYDIPCSLDAVRFLLEFPNWSLDSTKVKAVVTYFPQHLTNNVYMY